MTEPTGGYFDALFEPHGVYAIQARLAAMGPGSGSIVLGLGSIGRDVPTRANVEEWLRRKEAEREAKEAERRRQQDRWTKAGVILAAVATVLAALSAILAAFSWLDPLK